MLWESIAFIQIDNRTSSVDDASNHTGEPAPISLPSEDALRRANKAVTELVKLARRCNSSPHLISHASPFLPLCFFVGARYLLAAQAFETRSFDGAALTGVTLALGGLSKLFPEAGLSLASKNLIQNNIEKPLRY